MAIINNDISDGYTECDGFESKSEVQYSKVSSTWCRILKAAKRDVLGMRDLDDNYDGDLATHHDSAASVRVGSPN